MSNINCSGLIIGGGKATELYNQTSGSANKMPPLEIENVSKFNYILVTYRYSSATGNICSCLYPVGFLKMISGETVGEAENYHSFSLEVDYDNIEDKLTLTYKHESKAYCPAIYGIN